MKALVAYYSRTGNSKKIALEIAKKLNADIDEIKDKKKKGIFGMVWSCRQAIKRKSSLIDYSKDASDYDLVVLGGPVWAFNLLPQLRKYLEENKIKKLGFFLTYGGNPGKSFEQADNLKKTIATAGFIDKDIRAGKYKDNLNKFVKELSF
jgi:flavodoxin